jgi:uncharacterized LabA/DUF88 family protein
VPSRPAARGRERCIIFIDGSNFYHQIRKAGLAHGALSYPRLAQRLVLDREWLETRYYVGEVTESGGQLRVQQRTFLDSLRAHPRQQVVLGTIQKFHESNPLAGEILHYLAGLRVRINRHVYRWLVETSKRHSLVETYKEKGVDVALACDMVRFAQEDRYDVAYLISNDGDLRPAVELARSYGKRVFAAGCVVGPKLQEVCNSTIILRQDWLRACP